MKPRELYGIFKIAFKDWLEDNATLRAAALTFFIILPLPTLLLLAVGIFSLFFGEFQAIRIVVLQISVLAGPIVAGLFYQLLSSAGSPFTSVWTALVVVGFSVGGAIGAFSVLRDTMDCIWEVTLPEGRPLWKRIRQKIVPFAVVSALGLLVIVWTALASGFFNLIALYSADVTLAAVATAIVQVAFSLVVAISLLAIIYKMIPESKIHWQDVTLASVTTGVAFTITNYVFGTYISAFTVTTVTGAAGSLLIILLWIFVLNEIVLYGAEVSKVYAVTVGKHVKTHLPGPVKEAVEPIVEAGEKIEAAAKEDVVKTGKPAVKSEGKQATSEHVPEETEKEAEQAAKKD